MGKHSDSLLNTYILWNTIFQRLTSNMFFTVMAFSFAVKEVSLMDQGLNAKQHILQLEQVSYELCMLENYADYAASNMFLNHPTIFLDFH